MKTILGYPADQIMAMQQKTYVAPTVKITPARITPSQYEKNEWSRMAQDAYSRDLNDIGHKFSMAAILREGEDCSLAWFDALQAEYRTWLVEGFKITRETPLADRRESLP